MSRETDNEISPLSRNDLKNAEGKFVLPREMNRTNDSTFDRIYKYYHNTKTRIELTTEEQGIRERWEKAWLLLCGHNTAKEVADMIQNLFNVGRSKAFDDVRFAMMLFSNPDSNIKEAKRAIAETGLLWGAKTSKAKGDLEMHLKYMKEYNAINKLYAENEDSNLAELIKNLKPTSITIVASTEDLTKMADKLQKEIIQDIPHEELEHED